MDTASYHTRTYLSTVYDPNGDSTATLDITLTNLTSQNYPKSLKIFIHGPKIRLLQSFPHSYDPVGINVIDLALPQKNVGLRAVSNFQISYQNPKTQKENDSWIVNLPKISLGTPGDFVYRLSIPKEFGELITAENLNLLDLSQSQTGIYTLSGNSLPYSSKLFFGQTKPFKYTVQYQNTQEVFLPKDTPNQKIYIAEISPKPVGVYLENHNWVAKYTEIQSIIKVTGFAVFQNRESLLETSAEIVDLQPEPRPYQSEKQVLIDIVPPKLFLPFISNTTSINVYNPNPYALYNLKINLAQTTRTVSTIPPHGTATLAYQTDLPKSLQISTQNLQFSYNPNYFSSYAIIFLILVIAIYAARFTWGVFISRRK